MISVITRCRNRLEYTAQVLDAVKRRTHIPYEHIIVDNASSDGTKEWFSWMAKNSWYDNVKYLRMERNCGDWGGMLVGAEAAKGDFIVQLDNDIIPCDGWLSALHSGLVGTKYNVVMLRRENVHGPWILRPQSSKSIVAGLEIVKVERAVACYMMSKEDFGECARVIPEKKGADSKYLMGGLRPRLWKGLKPIGKIINRTCTEIEATKDLEEKKLDQRQKYDPKNPQVWEKV